MALRVISVAHFVSEFASTNLETLKTVRCGQHRFSPCTVTEWTLSFNESN